MNRLSKIAGILLLLTLVAGAAWALADSKSVNFLFEAAWEVDETLPGGGVIVSRGEGSNGVITVDLPMPPPTDAVEPPIELNADDVTYMDIKVKDENGVEHHYTEDHIKTVNYNLEFEYEWDNGTTQKYVVKNTVKK
ncbi:MAG: hypothetical protein IH600_05030 [Bacteroidetes bacterium]|nr:hypothetical protein [Bacteroidota bacterium]